MVPRCPAFPCSYGQTFVKSHVRTTTTTTTTQAVFSQACPFFYGVLCENSFRLSTMAGVDSAAARRRQRRLRQFLRHERLSVAMALAESQRGARGARRVTTTEALSSPAGASPVVGGRARRGAGQHLGLWSGTSWRTWEASARSCKFLISCAADGRHGDGCLADSGPAGCRSGYRCAHDLLVFLSLACGLVEVPTVLSVAVVQQQTVEQAADVPVPLGRGRRLHGSLPKQSSTAAGAEQTVDFPRSWRPSRFSSKTEIDAAYCRASR